MSCRTASPFAPRQGRNAFTDSMRISAGECAPMPRSSIYLCAEWDRSPPSTVFVGKLRIVNVHCFARTSI